MVRPAHGPKISTWEMMKQPSPIEARWPMWLLLHVATSLPILQGLGGALSEDETVVPDKVVAPMNAFRTQVADQLVALPLGLIADGGEYLVHVLVTHRDYVS